MQGAPRVQTKGPQKLLSQTTIKAAYFFLLQLHLIVEIGPVG